MSADTLPRSVKITAALVANGTSLTDRASWAPRGTETDWRVRHNQAIVSPRRGHELAIVSLISALWEYRAAHSHRLDSDVLEDAFLGDHFSEIARGIRGLLNGESGRLDCGTLDASLVACLPEGER